MPEKRLQKCRELYQPESEPTGCDQCGTYQKFMLLLFVNDKFMCFSCANDWLQDQVRNETRA